MTRPPESGDGRRLLLDAMLGKLATYLRMCGYDTAYALDRGIEGDEELRAAASEENRILLTRDRSLADHTAAEPNGETPPGSVLLVEREVTDQLRELRDAGFDLSLSDPPARCGRCNGRLETPASDASRPEYVPDQDPVWRCRDCGQWFWKGSHWADVEARLADVRTG
ncbi:Mut7-C RNAse domain-containing protein [Halalkaliarchaeum sp. AArc-GB]|uniref:Mut7-C RNAse domain-containing protein n=1 Tax=Halalkaliarchaeum sp. AArc-GB TaxID=3074078 RepID=UPI00285DD5F4|nr:Mut7-C RNAse domain-containing protein [Halalkaliarchaeum sp. AArc-GB]MDR5672699.1 Mut7-C RNAse domain-containing protein [Halalkaliarchaeum sp. AArc-GB]